MLARAAVRTTPIRRATLVNQRVFHSHPQIQNNGHYGNEFDTLREGVLDQLSKIDHAAPKQSFLTQPYTSPPPKRSKLLGLWGAIIAFAGFPQFEGCSKLQFLDWKIERKYPFDEIRVDFKHGASFAEYLNNRGGDGANITVITEGPRSSDDYSLLQAVVPESKFVFESFNRMNPIELLNILLKIEDEDGRQTIVLPPQPNNISKSFEKIYSRVLMNIISYLVLQKGFIVIAPAPSEPGVYFESLPILLTCTSMEKLFDNIHADLFVPRRLNLPLSGLYVAGAIARLKNGLLREGISIIPSKRDIREFFPKLNGVGPTFVKYAVPEFSLYESKPMVNRTSRE